MKGFIITKGMDSFKLVVKQSHLYQWIHGPGVVNKLLKVGHFITNQTFSRGRCIEYLAGGIFQSCSGCIPDTGGIFLNTLHDIHTQVCEYRWFPVDLIQT